MKFKEKIYFITLSIFLVFFNVGILLLAIYVHQTSVGSERTVAYSEEKVIVDSFEKDLEYFNGQMIDEIIVSYLNFYDDKNIYLCFEMEGRAISNLPTEMDFIKTGYSISKRIDGKRYFIVCESICEEKCIFTFAKDVSYLDDDFKNICLVFLTMSLVSSFILSIVLFITFKKLSSPLDKLRLVASEIAEGSFQTRAAVYGNDEFSLLAKDFNRMADHIIEKMNELDLSTKTKQRILDDLSHEMKTPLTSIRGYAEFLLNANISEKERIESLEFIISESERLKLISQRMLEDAFIRENGIDASEVDLSELIENYLKVYKHKSEYINICLNQERAMCICDPLLIEVLFSNIFDNAVKACRGKGNILINVGIDNSNRPFFSIEDDGIGMEEHQLKKITEPFYRTDKSRSRDEGGTGLGLSLCDRIVKAHNANMYFESSIDVGTKVSVYFTNP